MNEDPALQRRFAEAYASGPAALAALAQANGYAVSAAEAAEALERVNDNELSEFELELISGGGNSGTGGNDKRDGG